MDEDLQQRLPTREHAWAEVGGPIASFIRDELDVHSSVGSPIVVVLCPTRLCAIGDVIPANTAIGIDLPASLAT